MKRPADMSLQEVFDTVATHLLTQKKRSFDAHEEMCAYRAGGLSCAVGCLISDELYSPALEGSGVLSLVPGHHVEVFARVGEWLFGDAEGFDYHNKKRVLLLDLQDVHDDLEPEDWRAALAKVAFDHGLVMRWVKT